MPLRADARFRIRNHVRLRRGRRRLPAAPKDRAPTRARRRAAISAGMARRERPGRVCDPSILTRPAITAKASGRDRARISHGLRCRDARGAGTGTGRRVRLAAG